MRCNLDVQDLRRVLSQEHWMRSGEVMPHIGNKPEWGYMNLYEWNGSSYDQRLPVGKTLEGEGTLIWKDSWAQEEWRDILLALLCMDADDGGAADQDLLREASAQFGDGINTGFYINSYTTKHCPTMEGVLEELRTGIQRLENQRQDERRKIEERSDTTEAQLMARQGRSTFADVMRTLTRLSSSYRRCYWKSGSESMFPILFGHMTFASHRTWAVYVKKAIFLAMEAWRGLHGETVRRAVLADSGGELLKVFYTDARGNKSLWPLRGWKRVEVDGESLLEGPNGEIAATKTEA